MKKTLSWILSAALMLAMLPAQVLAADTDSNQWPTSTPGTDGVYTLTDDVTLTEVYTVDSDVTTLDISTYTISADVNGGLQVGHTLTIKGTGSVMAPITLLENGKLYSSVAVTLAGNYIELSEKNNNQYAYESGDALQPIDFGSATAGYSQLTARSIADYVVSNDTDAVTITEATLASGDQYFSMDTTGWTIQPKTGLGAGTYMGTITVKGTVNNLSFGAVGTVTFIVNPSGGGSTGGGGGGGGSSSGSGSQTTTTTNPDGSVTTVTTAADGTVTTVTTDTAGNKTTVVENTDGTTVTTIELVNGATSTTTEAANGQVTAEVTLPAGVVDAANAANEAVVLPIPDMPYTTSSSRAPVVTVNVPNGSTVQVEIPMAQVTPGTVAILVGANGAETVVKTSVPTDNGVVLTIQGSSTIKVMDNSKSFGDVGSSDWYSDAVAFVSARELFNGTGANAFSPNRAATRGMVVTVLARLDGYNTTPANGEDWQEPGRRWAMTTGVSNGANMTSNISRQELATMIWRYAGSPASTYGLGSFNDAGQISSWADTAMRWCVEQGILSGKGNGIMDPQGSATRAELAQILMNYIQG